MKSLIILFSFFSTLQFCLCVNSSISSTLADLKRTLTNIQKDAEEFAQIYEQLVKDVISLNISLKRPKCGPCVESFPPNGGCDCTTLEPKRDCLEFFKAGFQVDGIYRIQTGSKSTTDAYCDQTTQGGGWTVIQRRKDGAVDFNRSWRDYKKGFGKPSGEFWIGNDMIHDLTTSKSELLIHMKLKWYKEPVYARYSTFEISDEQKKYALKISGYSGAYYDERMSRYNGMMFSTKDQDNDKNRYGNCAVDNDSGWWFNSCGDSNLNGLYKAQYGKFQICWGYKTPEFVEMKVRRIV